MRVFSSLFVLMWDFRKQYMMRTAGVKVTFSCSKGRRYSTGRPLVESSTGFRQLARGHCGAVQLKCTVPSRCKTVETSLMPSPVPVKHWTCNSETVRNGIY
jgi:hypothetical protein